MRSAVTLVGNGLLIAITKTIGCHEKEAQLMTDPIYQMEHIHTCYISCWIVVFRHKNIASDTYTVVLCFVMLVL